MTSRTSSRTPGSPVGGVTQATANAAYETVVNHGSTAGTARPVGAGNVRWIGSVAPTNAVTNDLWRDTANELDKRYTGSAWVAAGNGTYAPLVPEWLPTTVYKLNQLATHAGTLYQSTSDHTSGSSWTGANWAAVSATDATTSAKGIVQLAGDLAGTAALPTVPLKVSRYGGTTATAAAAPVANAADWGVVADGTTDCSTQMAAVATAVAAAGGGTILLPAGTILAADVPVKSFVAWEGRGVGATVVKLPAGSTGHVFKGDNFDTLTTTTVSNATIANVPKQWAIRRLSINGNKANAASAKHGIAVYAAEMVIEDVDVYQCKQHGMWVEYADSGVTYTTNLMESELSRVKAFDNGQDGIHVAGGHDTMAANCIAARNGNAGFYASGKAWNWVNCHSWGAQVYAWYLTGGNQLTNCQGEGATDSNFYINWHDVRIIGGLCFFPGSSTAVGVKFVNNSVAPLRTRIHGLSVYGFSSASGAAFDLTNVGAQTVIDASVDQASGTVVAGSLPADAVVKIAVGGGVGGGNIYQLPGYTAVTPPGIPSDHGLLGWNINAQTVNGSRGVTSGTPFFVKVRVTGSGTISKVYYSVKTAGSGLTSGQNLIGVYDSTGVLIGSTADLTTAFASAGPASATVTVASGKSLAVAPGTVLYVAFMSNGSTPATFEAHGNSGGGVSPYLPNINLTAAGGYSAWTVVSAQTALPTSVTMSSASAQFAPIWAGVS